MKTFTFNLQSLHTYHDLHNCLVSLSSSTVVEFVHIGYRSDSFIFQRKYLNGFVDILQLIDYDPSSIYLKLNDLHPHNLCICAPTNVFVLNIQTPQENLKFFGLEMTRMDDSIIKFDFSVLSPIEYLRVGMDLIHAVQQVQSLGYYLGELNPSNICIKNHELKLVNLVHTRPLTDEKMISLQNSPVFTSPAQACRWLEAKQMVSQNDKYEELLSQIKFHLISNYKFNDHMDESVYNNDWFCTGLMLIYIYGNRYSFWYRDRIDSQFIWTNDTVEYENILLFLKDPHSYIDNVFNEINLTRELKCIINSFLLYGLIPN